MIAKVCSINVCLLTIPTKINITHLNYRYKFTKPLTNSRKEIINSKLHPINVNIKLFNKIISARK